MKKTIRTLLTRDKLPELKQFLAENPSHDISQDTDDWRYTMLEIASITDQPEIVAVLLAHPHIDINQKSQQQGWNPLYLACAQGLVEVVKIFMRDSRTDVNITTTLGPTPLWQAAYRGCQTTIKWMIALRGDEIDYKKKGRFSDSPRSVELSAQEIASVRNKGQVVSLLQRVEKYPAQTRYEIQLELGFPEARAAELFALTVFLCDDFLRLKETSSLPTPTSSFFRIAQQLPMEIQMIMCHRVYGSSKGNISSKISELAFKNVIKEVFAE